MVKNGQDRVAAAAEKETGSRWKGSYFMPAQADRYALLSAIVLKATTSNKQNKICAVKYSDVLPSASSEADGHASACDK